MVGVGASDSGKTKVAKARNPEQMRRVIALHHSRADWIQKRVKPRPACADNQELLVTSSHA
jgi:hypothetical protein